MDVVTSPIPIVDLAGHLDGSPAATDDAADAIGRALEDVGFVYIVGHGLDWSLVAGIYEQARRFFALPAEAKMAVAADASREGYTAVGNLMYPTPGSKPALNEVFGVFDESSGLNQWPDLDGFRAGVLAYQAAVTRLGHSLLPLIARSLDVPDDFFTQRFAHPIRSLTLRHYPVVQAEDDQWGLGVHSDGGFLTLLPDNEVPGLAIRLGSTTWADAPSVPGSFLVNSGSMLRRWTNDRFLSTEHRVLNATTKDRYAVPFFYLPTPGVEVAPLPSCVSEANPARYEPITFDFSADRKDEAARRQGRVRSHLNYADAPVEDASALDA
jgi:isopenicillin N synthase-like dioxygenase